ncbi:hypothetical protein ZIOFF_006630 [Zingiber officinale]|uniref:Core-2/I-branching beta-1,6-N-acetylglucosaminyltransferase family protein n=1 Tax=Zingiber officinale TaxID=94328 RepID=A0A8J5HSH2_ZINOF|nr:hypothetical protein ZIOFF_006630 [Zingiber officinale]
MTEAKNMKLPVSLFLQSLLLCGLGFALGTISSFYLTPPTLRFFLQHSSTPPPPSSMVNHTPAAEKQPGGGGGGLGEFHELREVMHDMTEGELLWRASMVPRVKKLPFEQRPKVAFLFLTRGELPLAPLWERFFEGNEGSYSIYVHADPDFNGSEPEPHGSVFQCRRIPSKVTSSSSSQIDRFSSYFCCCLFQTVSWGGMNMMEAERRLLANALLDFSNQRFVLLSESCIPLFDFPTVYSYLINSTRVHVESKDVPGRAGRGRFPARFRPRLQPRLWRKGSQWFEVDREVAVAVVADRDYFPLFQKHCSRCYADEHYLPTLVGVRFPARTHNRSVTWVDWSRGGVHPAMYSGEHVTAELLERMRNGSSCDYNGRATRTCFLFARKFSPSSLRRLMRFAPELMGFKSKAIAK